MGTLRGMRTERHYFNLQQLFSSYIKEAPRNSQALSSPTQVITAFIGFPLLLYSNKVIHDPLPNAKGIESHTAAVISIDLLKLCILGSTVRRRFKMNVQDVPSTCSSLPYTRSVDYSQGDTAAAIQHTTVYTVHGSAVLHIFPVDSVLVPTGNPLLNYNAHPRGGRSSTPLRSLLFASISATHIPMLFPSLMQSDSVLPFSVINITF